MSSHLFTRTGSIALFSAACTILVARPQPARADTTLWVDDFFGQLGTVNLTTGAVSVIGFTQVGTRPVTLSDIAFDPSGNLWGIDFNQLYRVDKTTAALTAVGAPFAGDLNALVFAPDGSLYAASSTSNTLFRLDTGGGAPTVVGNFGAGVVSSGDLAFRNNTLYLSASGSPFDSLVTFDLGTNTPGAVGNLGHDFVYGMAFGDGVLYGVSRTQVFSINPNTAATVNVLDFGSKGLGDTYGTAFLNEAAGPLPSAPLPGVAGAGLVLMGSLGLLRLRRRS